MQSTYLALVSGFLLGLSSSLHCVGMCSGISVSMLYVFEGPRPADRFRTMLLAHLGRATSYVAIGTLLGALGASPLGMLPSPLAYRLLQWAAAVSLMWIGLSTAGLLPSFAAADRVLAPVSAAVGNVAARYKSSRLGPFGMGVAWGVMPCAMLYGAFLTAMLSGRAVNGAVVLAGFALATMPALAATTMGVRGIAAKAKGRLRVVVGLSIAMLGFGAVYLAPAIGDALCR